MENELYSPKKRQCFHIKVLEKCHWSKLKSSDWSTHNMSLFPHCGTQKTSIFPFPRTVFTSCRNSDVLWVPWFGNGDIILKTTIWKSDTFWEPYVEIVTFFEGCITCAKHLKKWIWGASGARINFVPHFICSGSQYLW